VDSKTKTINSFKSNLLQENKNISNDNYNNFDLPMNKNQNLKYEKNVLNMTIRTKKLNLQTKTDMDINNI